MKTHDFPLTPSQQRMDHPFSENEKRKTLSLLSYVFHLNYYSMKIILNHYHISTLY